MPLDEVELATDVYMVCLAHALTTEREEVMGVLLGDVEADPVRGNVARIWDVVILTRSDKRKDRVEIDPDQLTYATQEAERVSHLIGRRTRVIAWYHSHPHITCLPSHVDIKTQALQQLMDDCFVGLIFSVFNEDASKAGHIQVVAFQSERMDSSDSRGDYAGGLRERLIPIQMIHAPFPQHLNPLLKLVDLQQILLAEEREAYEASLSSAPSGANGRASASAEQVPSLEGTSPLVVIHNAAVFQKALCRLMEYGIAPMERYLRDRVKQARTELKTLEEMKKAKLKTSSGGIGR